MNFYSQIIWKRRFNGRRIRLSLVTCCSHYIKKCLLHQVLIQQNMYIVALDKISHLQVKIVAIVT